MAEDLLLEAGDNLQRFSNKKWFAPALKRGLRSTSEVSVEANVNSLYVGVAGSGK